MRNIPAIRIPYSSQVIKLFSIDPEILDRQNIGLVTHGLRHEKLTQCLSVF